MPSPPDLQVRTDAVDLPPDTPDAINMRPKSVLFLTADILVLIVLIAVGH